MNAEALLALIADLYAQIVGLQQRVAQLTTERDDAYNAATTPRRPDADQ